MIPAGGLSPDHQRWVHPRYSFFLPVKVLSRVFRGKFIAGLKCAFHQRKLVFPGGVKRLAEVHEFGMEADVIGDRVLDAMRENRFHIFSHPEFKDELRELFDEILLDFRDYPADPGHDKRIGFEKMRRESYKQQRKGLKT